MKTLIIYGSKHGATEKCTNLLKGKLDGEVTTVNVKKDQVPDIALFDKVIIGGSIYIGSIQKEIKEFCSKNVDTLKDKKLGLFICCMRDGNEAQTQITAAFPQELISNASAWDYFGGEFTFSKMNMIEKFITKKIAKIDKDTSNILTDNIDQFAKLMNGVSIT
jgi:menaquinone-dependent protoporphyrinogen oxidase